MRLRAAGAMLQFGRQGSCLLYWSWTFLMHGGTDAAKVVRPKSAGDALVSSKKLWSLGPFASGKTEYEGDPLAPLGGVHHLYEKGPGRGKTHRKFYAEHALGGTVSWKPSQAMRDDSGYTLFQLPTDGVPFRNLQSNPPLGSPEDILHVQYWVVWPLKVKKPGRFAVDCHNMHTFEIAHGSGTNTTVIAPLAANIYTESFGLYSTAVDFVEAGTYLLMSRLRGKVPLDFRCAFSVVDKAPALHAELTRKNLPDVVLGRLITGASPLDLRVRNFGQSWIRVQAEVTQASKVAVKVKGSSRVIQLAPGLAAQLPVVVTAEGPEVEKEAAACAHFEVTITIDSQDGSKPNVQTVAGQLRCRKSTQSALLSFLDPDGSVGNAAVLWPRNRAAPSSLPILVSMSGVGVQPQQQADAYKMKPTPKDPKDYIFGFEDLWVLVPQRGGPHNWEDVGMRTILRSIEVLAAAPVTPSADPMRLIVHGHSRGGHGAWGLATRIPDRVLGVASACGWYSREDYGDANNMWVHETSLMHMDKVLQGLLHASVAENVNSFHASNLRGIPALVRTASRDYTVQPYFSRRMARHLKEEGVNVTFQELDQEHWWWDSKVANDGGVMHDEAMRSWTIAVAKAGVTDVEKVLENGELVIAASSPEYEGRFGLRILQRTSPASRAFVRVRRAARGIELRTANVLRLRIASSSMLSRALDGTAIVDGATVAFDTAQGVELCLRGGTDHVQAASNAATCKASGDNGACLGAYAGRHWQQCTASVGAPLLSRGPALLGPIRRVFAEPWVVVVPDRPSQLEERLATYFAAGHHIAVDTATQVLTFSEALAFRATHRFVWLGGPHRFPDAVRQPWPVNVFNAESMSSLEQNREGEPWGSFSIGPCIFEEGHGLAFIAPAVSATGVSMEGISLNMSAASRLLDLVVTATDAQALVDLVSFSFATNQAHTRAPMSNMLPDFFVTGPQFRWKGSGGIVAAGYLDAEWGIAPHSAYFNC